MSKVFVSMGLSLDGYVAGPNRSLQNMGGDGWGSLHSWVFGQRVFREKLKLGICGEHGGDPDSIRFCHDSGLDYVSCSPFRVPVARLAAAQAALKRARGDV